MSRYYFGGELFSLKHLLGNVALAQAVNRVSNGKYEAVLPQDVEVTNKRGKAIRDVDILTLLSCDLALFHFDGTELDSGSVAEFMLAKFADIPTVLLRTDFRKAGDSPHDPWNLMLCDYPRTEKVILNGMDVYSAARSTVTGSDDDITQKATAQFVLDGVASRVVESFDKVVSTPPRLPSHLREPVKEWLSLMPNFIMDSREAFGIDSKEPWHCSLPRRQVRFEMSKAQKLVNSAKAVLQRRQQNHLNDQKALAEIRNLIDRTEDGGSGTASEQVKLAKKTMQQHKENALDDQQAIRELSRIFAGPTVARQS